MSREPVFCVLCGAEIPPNYPFRNTPAGTAHPFPETQCLRPVEDRFPLTEEDEQYLRTITDLFKP